MPTWWSKKPCNSTKTQQQNQPKSVLNFNFINSNKSPITKVNKNGDKSKSFDEVTGAAFLHRNSPRASKDFTSHGGETDGGDKIGLPLPRPSLSSTYSNEQGFVFGSGSLSGGSSVSSIGSIDDHSIFPINATRGKVDMKFNVRSKSPGPGSRGPTSPTSPLHPKLKALSLDSATSKQEDIRSQSHPLPLPPSSPTSPSSLSNTRANGQVENNFSNRGKWKKGKLLGRGTFGHVYQGFHSESGQMCAIKEVRAVCDDQSSKECLKQLNQEIYLLSQLSHPNIVQYYGSDLGEESLSVYLEFVSGGSIHKLLKEYGPFGEPIIQNYTRQIVSGLSYLHGRNTVHRDIKGANILVDPNGEIKLADFGMAKHINSSTSVLSFKGSPHWMAPEIVMNTHGYRLPVDIWSLGCTILEMATSNPPWSQYEGVAAIFKIGNSKDMPEIPEHLSNDAKNFIKLCLQRDPSARPTAQMLLDHPFIRDQSATKSVNISLTRDAFPYVFDGSQTPPVLEHHSNSNRTNNNLINGDYAANKVVGSSRAVRSPRDNTRMITSLPVSPCSSPLRQYGSSDKNYFLSPHPSYTMMGQNNLNSYPLRSNATFPLDSWQEKSLYGAYTPPGGSPRTRPI